MFHATHREARLLEEQANGARAGLVGALDDFRREVRTAAAPVALLQRHPLGACVAAGLLGWLAVGWVRGGAVRRRGGAWLPRAADALRNALVGSLLTRAVWSAFGPGARRGLPAQRASQRPASGDTEWASTDDGPFC